jgi:hypothetical protein
MYNKTKALDLYFTVNILFIHYILMPAKIRHYKLRPSVFYLQLKNQHPINPVNITLIDLIPNHFSLIDFIRSLAIAIF